MMMNLCELQLREGRDYALKLQTVIDAQVQTKKFEGASKGFANCLRAAIKASLLAAPLELSMRLEVRREKALIVLFDLLPPMHHDEARGLVDVGRSWPRYVVHDRGANSSFSS
jgi:hypothetical protein